MAGLDRAKAGNPKGAKVSRFADILDAAESTNSEFQPPEKLGTQKSEKLAKRDDPSFTQTTFRIPKKLSRDLDRLILDLEDEGLKLDRSDLLIELAGALLRTAEKEGAVEAIEVFKNLGIQKSR